MEEFRVIRSGLIDDENSIALEKENDLDEHKIFQTHISFELFAGISGNQIMDYDEDGDLILPRAIKGTIVLDHSMETILKDVGFQLWTAALLLCDYIIHFREKFVGKTVLELGSGVGICSMVASLFSKKVFCTDVGTTLLSLTQRNIDRFLEHWNILCDNYSAIERSVLVRKLDWHQKSKFCTKSECEFGWAPEEINSLQEECNLFLASDVIYDDEITCSFFNTLVILMQKDVPSIFIMSLEKRLNFALETLDVRSPPYDYFIESINNLKKSVTFSWNIYREDTDFPQSFHYNKTEYLELWIFECQKL